MSRFFFWQPQQVLHQSRKTCGLILFILGKLKYVQYFKHNYFFFYKATSISVLAIFRFF